MSAKYHLPLYWHAAALFLTWCSVQYLDGKAAESDQLRERRAWGYMRVQCSKMSAEPALDVDGRFICQRPNGQRVEK